ncbi:MAG: hypothetical protein BGO69_15815 [Bacteroidetes bacterium 46-16]|nr:MAG: hypothetical protein BGO69_15815 [Bacteroidetes bacterium 46-16]
MEKNMNHIKNNAIQTYEMILLDTVTSENINSWLSEIGRNINELEANETYAMYDKLLDENYLIKFSAETIKRMKERLMTDVVKILQHSIRDLFAISQSNHIDIYVNKDKYTIKLVEKGE